MYQMMQPLQNRWPYECMYAVNTSMNLGNFSIANACSQYFQSCQENLDPQLSKEAFWGLLVWVNECTMWCMIFDCDAEPSTGHKNSGFLNPCYLINPVYRCPIHKHLQGSRDFLHKKKT